MSLAEAHGLPRSPYVRANTEAKHERPGACGMEAPARAQQGGPQSTAQSPSPAEIAGTQEQEPRRNRAPAGSPRAGGLTAPSCRCRT